MKLETIERAIQWAGAAGAVISVAAVYSGIVRGARRPRGEETEDLPDVARLSMSGSPRFYLPSTVAALWLLRLLWRPIYPGLPRSARTVLLIVGSLLYFPGLALTLWGRLTMKEMYNVSSNLGAQLYSDHRLVTSGPFRFMRHPMYVGGIMAELGALLLYRTWTALLIAFNVPFLPIRARYEERLLAARFGAEWEEYARKAPMWPLPGLRTED